MRNTITDAVSLEKVNTIKAAMDITQVQEPNLRNFNKMIGS